MVTLLGRIRTPALLCMEAPVEGLEVSDPLALVPPPHCPDLPSLSPAWGLCSCGPTGGEGISTRAQLFAEHSAGWFLLCWDKSGRRLCSQGPQNGRGLCEERSQQLLWCQGKAFLCEGISFPGKEMHAGKAHCQ